MEYSKYRSITTSIEAANNNAWTESACQRILAMAKLSRRDRLRAFAVDRLH